MRDQLGGAIGFCTVYRLYILYFTRGRECCCAECVDPLQSTALCRLDRGMLYSYRRNDDFEKENVKMSNCLSCTESCVKPYQTFTEKLKNLRTPNELNLEIMSNACVPLWRQ